MTFGGGLFFAYCVVLIFAYCVKKGLIDLKVVNFYVDPWCVYVCNQIKGVGSRNHTRVAFKSNSGVLNMKTLIKLIITVAISTQLMLNLAGSAQEEVRSAAEQRLVTIESVVSK